MTTGNSFSTANQVVTFCCPQCGYVSETEQRAFQVYENQVAMWLDGSLPPIGQADFDVWKCAKFPKLTFQVKFSNFGTQKIKKKKWTWNHNSLRDENPDYFILCGEAHEDEQYWFVMSRDDFKRHGGSNGKGGYVLEGTYPRFVKRGGGRSTYLHENTIWRFHVKEPEKMAERIIELESWKQLGLL